MNDLHNVSTSLSKTQNDRLMTTEEVATWLGIKRSTLEKARSMRLGDYPPFVRIGRVVRYVPADVKAWIHQRAFNVDGSRSHPDEC